MKLLFLLGFIVKAKLQKAINQGSKCPKNVVKDVINTAGRK